jgi:general secretion pathway protein E
MSAVVQEPAADTLSASQLAELRGLARDSGRTVWEVLEDRLGLAPGDCLARLGATLRMPVLDMEALHRLEPDFSVLPYADAVERRCLLARGSEVPVCVLTDPFELALQTWLETRLGAAPAWHLAHPAASVGRNNRRALRRTPLPQGKWETTIILDGITRQQHLWIALRRPL